MTDRIPPPLAELGWALFGEQWVSPLARALHVNLRTMQRWAAGTKGEANEAVIAAIAELLRERRDRINELLKHLPPPS